MPHPDGKRILFVTASASAFLSHRLNLGLEAIRRGYEVHVACCADGPFRQLEAHGITVHHLAHMRRGSMNPLRMLGLVGTLWRLYRHLRPCLVHHVAQQPVIVGTLAARLAGIKPIVNALGGLGYLFTSDKVGRRPSFLKKILKICVELTWDALFTPARLRVIVQNDDDRDIMACHIAPEKICVIPGAGVNLMAFPFSPRPSSNAQKTLSVVMASRLLWDKGVAEYVTAAKWLGDCYPYCRFLLAGALDPCNPMSLKASDVQMIQAEGCVDLLGEVSSVSALYQNSDIVVLPSYREGMPKSLLEACAIGRPIVTTDVPGCRDVVADGVNGYVVPPRSAQELAEAIEKLLRDPALRQRMGEAGHQRAVAYYADSIIIAKTFEVYHQVMSPYDVIAQNWPTLSPSENIHIAPPI